MGHLRNWSNSEEDFSSTEDILKNFGKRGGKRGQ